MHVEGGGGGGAGPGRDGCYTMFELHREATLTCEFIALRPVPNWTETGTRGMSVPFEVEPDPDTSTTWTAYLDSSVMKSEIVYSAGRTTATR